MGCGSCGSSRVVVYTVRLPDGTVKRFLTEANARKYAAQHGGVYAQVIQ